MKLDFKNNEKSIVAIAADAATFAVFRNDVIAVVKTARAKKG